MPKNTTINRITNANIYMAGGSLLGKAEEITLPDVKYKQSDHKALGMFGEMEYTSGMEKLNGKIKWNSFYADVLKQTANPFKGIPIQVRSNMEIYEGGDRVDQVPVTTYLTIRSKGTPLGTFKAQDNAEAETEYSVSYFKQDINNETIIEVDVEANIWIVDGVDLLTDYRKNLGI